MTDSSGIRAFNSPEARLTQSRPLTANSGLRWIVGGAMIFFGLALGVLTNLLHRAELDARSASNIKAASEAHLLAVTMEKEAVETVGGVLVQDPRLRSTLSLSEIDEATIADILGDIKQVSGLDLVGALDDRGRVTALVGADQLRRSELGSSSLISKVMQSGRGGADLWSLDGRAMVVAAVPVQVGRAAPSFLLLGRALRAASVETLAQSFGLSAGLYAGGPSPQLTSQGASLDLLNAARSGTGTLPALTEVLSEGTTPIHVIWVGAKPALSARSLALSWSPTALGLVAGAILIAFSGRRSRS